ncbi:hypothetical protein ACFLZC_02250 [Patescibacteria group bacterium]
MIFVVLTVILLILAALSFWRFSVLKARGREFKTGEIHHDGIGYFFTFVTIVFFVVGLLASVEGYQCQVRDLEDIVKLKQIEVIYKTKAEALTAEFVKHLAKTYPEHEKDIYEKISPDKVTFYLAKYPELKASDTLITLVSRINELQTDVYNQQIMVEEKSRNIRVRLRSPWLFTFVIPTE